MSDILADLSAELLAALPLPAEYALPPDRLAAVTETMRLHHLAHGWALHCMTPAGVARIEHLDEPMPPLDGLMFRGVALRLAST